MDKFYYVVGLGCLERTSSCWQIVFIVELRGFLFNPPVYELGLDLSLRPCGIRSHRTVRGKHRCGKSSTYLWEGELIWVKPPGSIFLSNICLSLRCQRPWVKGWIASKETSCVRDKEGKKIHLVKWRDVIKQEGTGVWVFVVWNIRIGLYPENDYGCLGRKKSSLEENHCLQIWWGQMGLGA